LTQILISKKFEKEIVFETSVLAGILIRIELKCLIRNRIESIRIHNPGPGLIIPVIIGTAGTDLILTQIRIRVFSSFAFGFKI
jgi:hypothetical protein